MKTVIFIYFIFSLNFAFSQEFSFTFNPPEISYKQILDSKKAIIINGVEQREDEIIVESLINIKKNEKGYSVQTQPIKMNSKRNGQEFFNPMFFFLTNIPTIGEIDNNGNMINVTGFETLIPRAKKELSPEVMDQLILVANEESMINKTKAEWNARISDFAGETVELGEFFSGEGKFPLPNGETVTFFSIVKVADTVTLNGVDCVKIRFKNSSNPADLAKFMDKTVDELKDIFNFSANKDVDTKILITGEGYRIIDPKTMLIYYEINNRSIDIIDQEIGDESREVSTIETKEYKYEY
jgi:hypothetical protein